MSGDRPNEVDGIHNDARGAVVYDCVAVHVTSFTVGGRRGQAFDDSDGQGPYARLPAGRDGPGSGIFLLQTGRQSADRVIMAEKSSIFGAEIAPVAFVVAAVVIMVMPVIVIAALMLAVVVVIAIETGKGVRYGSERQGTHEKQSSIHGVRPADGRMRGQRSARMHGCASQRDRKDSPHKELVGGTPFFSPGESDGRVGAEDFRWQAPQERR